MSRSYRFDGQLFDALSGIGHDHVAVIRLYGTAVERPRDLQRSIALGDHALYRYEVSGVNGLLAEGDWCYLWGDCDTNDKIKYDSRKNRKNRAYLLAEFDKRTCKTFEERKSDGETTGENVRAASAISVRSSVKREDERNEGRN